MWRMDTQLRTVSDVIDALGGTKATASLLGRSMQAVTNWRAQGRFPAKTFLVLSRALEKQHASAPAALWGLDDPERAMPRHAASGGDAR